MADVEKVARAITNRQVCEAYAECKRNNRNDDGSVRYPYHVLLQVTGATEDECIEAMERAYDDDLIDVGTSLRTGWLTEKGMALITELWNAKTRRPGEGTAG